MASDKSGDSFRYLPTSGCIRFAFVQRDKARRKSRMSGPSGPPPPVSRASKPTNYTPAPALRSSSEGRLVSAQPLPRQESASSKMMRGLRFAGSKAFVGLSAAISTTAATASAVMDAEARKGELIAKGTRLASKDNPTVQTAQLCAYLCDRIYLPFPGSFAPEAMGFDCTVVLSNFSEQRSLGYCTNFAVLLSHSQRRVYVVFRGSTNIYDWLVNFEALPSPFFASLNLHSGVYSALKPHYEHKILPTLIQTFTSFPGYELVITGHSLGGGYATALALMFGVAQMAETTHAANVAVSSTPMQLFTFAAPTIMHSTNKQEATADVARLIDLRRCFNIVQHHDVVPRLLGGEYHANTLQLLSKVANINVSGIEEVKNYFALGTYLFLRYQRVKVTKEEAAEAPTVPPVTDVAAAPVSTPEVLAEAKVVETTKVTEVELWDCSTTLDLLLELPMALKGGRDALFDHSMTLYMSNMCLV